MKVLIFGATGGCGKHALTRLLEHGCIVVAMVRSAEGLPASAKGHPNLSVVVQPDGHLHVDLTEHLRDCKAVVRRFYSRILLYSVSNARCLSPDMVHARMHACRFHALGTI